MLIAGEARSACPETPWTLQACVQAYVPLPPPHLNGLPAVPAAPAAPARGR